MTTARSAPSTATRLAELETIIQRGIKARIETGRALREIRDTKLYKNDYDTFEQYCQERWGMERRTVYSYIEASGVADNVHTCAQMGHSQRRELASLKPAQQREVVEAFENRGGVKMATARDVKLVVAAVKSGVEPEEAVLRIHTAKGPGSLADRCGEPPFSVLDARGDRWQTRKRQWLATGIESERGRNAVVYQIDGKPSVFDPYLCELMYKWFSPSGGLVLDPFAGGSVRGIVASLLDRRYVGVDLSKKQIEANREQAERICKNHPQPEWQEGDSCLCAPNVQADFLFSCPPYADLEQYSDNPNDLSNMSWPDFQKNYKQAIRHAARRLKPDRFAGFVLGSVRDKRTGELRLLDGITIEAFAEAGLRLHNEMILVTPIGSLPVRSGNFGPFRTVGKGHQTVLVFWKGDRKRAAKAAEPIR